MFQILACSDENIGNYSPRQFFKCKLINFHVSTQVRASLTGQHPQHEPRRPRFLAPSVASATPRADGPRVVTREPSLTDVDYLSQDGLTPASTI